MNKLFSPLLWMYMSWKHGLWCQTVWVQSLSPTLEWSSLGLIFSSGNWGQHWNLLHRIVSRMKWDISYKGMHSVNGSYYYYLFLYAYSTGLKYFSKCFYPGEIFSFIICIHAPICKSITVSLSLSATDPVGLVSQKWKKAEKKGHRYGLKAIVGRHGNTCLAFRINTRQKRKLFSATDFLVSFLNHISALWGQQLDSSHQSVSLTVPGKYVVTLWK